MRIHISAHVIIGRFTRKLDPLVLHLRPVDCKLKFFQHSTQKMRKTAHIWNVRLSFPYVWYSYAGFKVILNFILYIIRLSGFFFLISIFLETKFERRVNWIEWNTSFFSNKENSHFFLTLKFVQKEWQNVRFRCQRHYNVCILYLNHWSLR